MSLFSSDKRLVEAAERQAAASERIASALEVIASTGIMAIRSFGPFADETVGWLNAIAYCLNRAGIPRVTFTSETKENDVKKILFNVVFAPEMDKTTVMREISVQVGDAPPDVRTVGVEVLAVEGFAAPVDTPVHIEQVDLDDVGNRSQPAVVDITVQDTFPPATPGVPSVVAVGELNEPDEPEPTPPTE